MDIIHKRPQLDTSTPVINTDFKRIMSTHTHGLKMMKKHIDAAENVQNPYVCWRTVDIHYIQYIQTSEPWEDRKVIYSKVAEYLRVQGYWFYGQGHALPGIFREKLKEAIPGDQHL
eukprot:322175_1